MARQYELECGLCGYLFTLEESALTRLVKCSVCGGVLSVAIPVPITPESPVRPPPIPFAPKSPILPRPVPSVPPTPGPLAPPSKPSEEPAPRFTPPVPDWPEPSELELEERALRLSPPWSSVRNGLQTARTAARLSLILAIPLVGLVLIVGSVADVPQRSTIRLLTWIVALGQLFPAAVHMSGQFACMKVPRQYGSRFASASLCLVWIAIVCLISFDAPYAATVAIVGSATAWLASCGFWFAFLARLGRQFGDYALEESVRWFALACVVGGIVIANLLFCAHLATYLGSTSVGGILRVGASLVGLWLLNRYAPLLRTASLAVARHAPVTSGR